MKPALRARWAELAPLLDRVLDLDPDDREDFILRAAGDDELRGLLRELLSGTAAAGILDGDSSTYAQALLSDEPPPAQRTHIGPYRILSLVGEGGSGSVYLAEREADGYVQRVALKLLRVGLRDPVEQERFRDERRILARLEHPHIARLLDGGFADDGVPWFAMEYVQGEPLTTWCDGRRLDVDARLRLFVDVCAAVSHAHHALIVHRDLKPANILVDADGRPHLLDFGIAKLLDAEQRGERTRTGWRRLTPGYAAPEQFDDGVITTATDVFALGVLLHELLAGSRPPRGSDGGARRMSVALAHDPARDAIANARSTSADALQRCLRGDLDTIVAMALAQDPRARYASVQALSEDIERYRSRRPVSARRASAWYLLGKFVRRQRTVVALSVLLLASLALGIAATWRESQNARTAAAQARHDAARASAVKDFVLALFAGVTPDESRGREIGARELLERGEARLAETLDRHPDLDAELSTVLAGAWRQLGRLERAEELARRAVHAAGNDPLAHAARAELAAILVARGAFDEAESMLRAALDSAPDERSAGSLRVSLAELLAERGHPDQAIALLDAALFADRDNPEHLSRDLAALGRVRFLAGDLAGAESALEDALEHARSLHGVRHTVTARREHDLAVILLQRGQTGTAAQLLESAISTRTQLLGERHPDVAQSRFNLAVARQRLGDSAAAHELYLDTLRLQRELLGNAHPDVAITLNSLSFIDFQQGRLDDAIARMDEAIAVARVAHGESHPNVATMLANLSAFERTAGRIDAAERHQRAALAAVVATLGDNHYLAGVTRLGLASVLIERGDAGAAITEQRRALEILEARLGALHADVLLARAALADSLHRTGETDAARTLLEPAGAARALDALAENDPRRARIRLVILRMSADCTASQVELRDVIAALARGGQALRADQALAELQLAHCLRQNQDIGDAAAALQRAVELTRSMPYVPRRLREALAGT